MSTAVQSHDVSPTKTKARILSTSFVQANISCVNTSSNTSINAPFVPGQQFSRAAGQAQTHPCISCWTKIPRLQPALRSSDLLGTPTPPAELSEQKTPSPTPSLIHAWNKCSDVPRWQLGTQHSTAAGQQGQALSTVPTVHQKAVGSAGSPLPCSMASPFLWPELLFGCRNPKCGICVAFFRAPSALDLCLIFNFFFYFL